MSRVWTVVVIGVASLGAAVAAGQATATVQIRPAIRHGARAAQPFDVAALDRLRAAAARPDPDGRAHHRLAVALRDGAIRRAEAGANGRTEALLLEGVAVGEVAFSRRPGSSAFATVLGDLHGLLARRGGVVARIRHGRRAAQLYARAVQLDPHNPLAYVGVGISKLETPALFGGSITAALEAFRRAQALDPRCASAWAWEGVALRRQGRMLQAREALVRALALLPDSRLARRELQALNEDFPE